jgi:2-dehydro-3-deoxy-D-arabinonate dehydratase
MSRGIEGENPRYLSQAKVDDRSAALAPCLVVDARLPGPEMRIALEIRRGGNTVFSGQTEVGRIKRPRPSLVEYLYRDDAFPDGALL